MLKVSDDSKDTLFRLSLMEKAKSCLSKLKHHELYFKLMSSDLKDLLDLKTPQKKKRTDLRLVSSDEFQI